MRHLMVVCLLGLASAMPYYAPYSVTEMDVDREIALIGLDTGYESQLNAPSSFEREYGGDYGVDSGYKGDRGYNAAKEFQKGKAAKRRVDRKRNQYKDNGGRKAGHQENSNHYSDRHAVEKASNGGDYLVAKHENKGSKTSGFHRVHHKEEYTKNKKFYDEKSEQGHYRRYGDFGAALLSASGAGEKGSKYDSGYRHADYGKEGFSDRGSLIDQLKEYAAANGYAGYGGNDRAYKTTGGLSDYKSASFH